MNNNTKLELYIYRTFFIILYIFLITSYTFSAITSEIGYIINKDNSITFKATATSSAIENAENFSKNTLDTIQDKDIIIKEQYDALQKCLNGN